MTAEELVRHASDSRAARFARALDIALTDYERRHGDVRFHVAAVAVEDGRVKFMVMPR